MNRVDVRDLHFQRYDYNVCWKSEWFSPESWRLLKFFDPYGDDIPMLMDIVDKRIDNIPFKFGGSE